MRNNVRPFRPQAESKSLILNLIFIESDQLCTQFYTFHEPYKHNIMLIGKLISKLYFKSFPV